MPREALELVVPMPPRLTNSEKGRSRHWRALKRERDAYWRALDDRQAAGLVPPPPPVPFPRAGISSVMHLGAAMDTDNAMARHKWVCDWLRTRGYVAEDRRDVLVWQAFPEQRIQRGQEYRIVLTLMPLTTDGRTP